VRHFNNISEDNSQHIDKLQKEVRFWKQVAHEMTKHYEKVTGKKNIRVKVFQN